MDTHNRRALRPRLEPMESRQLLSGLQVVLSGQAAAAHRHHDLVAIASAPGVNVGGSPSGPTAPVIPGQGQPTPQERARETFRAVFTGPFTFGPGRFTDQARILFLRGIGGSNNFLHGDYQMAVVFPKDTAATITGAAVLEDKNNNSSGIIGLDLKADPTSLDRLGRPTRLTFGSDPNIYSGIYFFNTSSGTIKITYHAKSATAVFQGLVYTNGLTSPLRNTDLVGRSGRLVPRIGPR